MHEFSLEVLTVEALSVWVEFIDESGEKNFLLADMFINKLKTKFNRFFYRMIPNKKESTTPFEEISPQELNKCLQKFYLSTRKRDSRSVITRQNCNRWQQ